MAKQKIAEPVAHSPWKPLGQRTADREIKRAAVLNTAAELFLARGYNGTRLNDVADQLHITKPALYNYFTSKEEILLACFEAGTVLLNEKLWSTDHAHLPGLERLQKFVETWALIMTKPFGRCMVLLDERELGDEYREQILKYKRDLDAKIRKIFKAGVADKSIAPLDPKLTVFAIMGSLNSIGRWYKSDGDL
jgi:AcrR family transcriptional regulator